MKKRRTFKRIIFFLICVVVFLWAASMMEARIGGGQKYSSKGTKSSRRSTGSYRSSPSPSSSSPSSSSRSSSSRTSTSYSSSSRSSGSSTTSRYRFSDSERNAIFMIVGGIVALIFLFIFSQTFVRALKKMIESRKIILYPPLDSKTRDQLVAQLQKEDPHFSLPLFLDFVQLLFTNLHTFAVKKKENIVDIYTYDMMSNPKRTLMETHIAIEEIHDIVIGSMSVLDIELDNSFRNSITIGFESNMTLRTKYSDKKTVYYDYSVWKLQRDKGIISKGPGELNKIACPHCGGTLDDNQEKKCPYCDHQFRPGKDTWALGSIVTQKRSKLSPRVSTEYAEEQGTQAPTIFQPYMSNRFAAFKRQYPYFSKSRFLKRVRFIFEMLQKAWSTREWEYARPFETDSLFQVHLYWINRYKKERIQNILEDIQIEKMELVKIMKDYYYDALTVRIHAAMIDYTISDKGKLLGGDRSKPRPFTEYWTFIRRAGIKEKESEMHQCPNCGYSLKVGMMGKCSHCETKITNGDFDWVLSMIEQDESYTG